MCIALTKESCAAASNAFQDRSTKKYYIALLRGHVSQKWIELDLPIGEEPDEQGVKVQKTFLTL